MKNKLLIFGLVLLSACGSQYSHRMVRVKKQKVAIQKREVLKATDKKREDKAVMEVASFDEVGTAELVSKVEELVLESEKTKRHSVKSIKRVFQSSAIDDKQDDPPSEDFIKRKYQQANNIAVASLIFLGLSVFLLFIGLIIALVLSIIAFRIYRKYKNPGVPERYVMAKTVLIISASLLALIAFLVGAFIYLILFL